MFTQAKWDGLMDSSRYFLLLILVFTFAGCQLNGSDSPLTPTPFAVGASTSRASASDPIAISLVHLAANPELFEGSTLQLTGQYQQLPRLVCHRDPFPSPATWGIMGDGLQASATGHDSQLKTLLAEGQQITAEGRWLRYNGPVGCGKSASAQEVWYLSVSRIVDPHPLARATSLPLEIAAGPTVIATDSITPTLLSASETPSILETVTVELLPTSTSPRLEATATSPASPPTVPSSLLTPSPTTLLLTATAVPTTTTATLAPAATETPASGTASATPSKGSATPQPSTTPSDQTPNNKGQLEFEDLAMANLNSGVIDNWTIRVDSNDSITITVAPATSANIVLSVLDETATAIVDRHDQASEGQVETITDLNLTNPGLYQIHITTEPGAQTNYALMVLDSESYNFTFKGTLSDSSPRTDSLTADNDHFWFFSASDGENINMSVTPIGDTDPYLELYGSDGSRLQTIDDTDSGETETLENYSILANGLYAIRVGEFDFAPMSYQITLDKS